MKEVKPGYKTTEFWLTVVAGLVGFAYASGAVGESTTLYQALGVVSTVLGALGYTISRGIAKK